MSEQLAASINCGTTAAGLPIRLQIVGQRHADLGVLQVARAWEQMRPPQRAWPQAPISLTQGGRRSVRSVSRNRRTP